MELLPPAPKWVVSLACPERPSPPGIGDDDRAVYLAVLAEPGQHEAAGPFGFEQGCRGRIE